MQKNPRHDWQTAGMLAILMILRLSLLSCWSAETVPRQASDARGLELDEARMARRAAEQKSAESNAALSRTEQEIHGLRRRYAELYLESRRQQHELDYIDLRIAGLLADREDIASGRALSRTLSALQQTQTAQQELTDKVHEFGTYLSSVLDIVQPSEALRREVAQRFDALAKAAERSVKPLPSVAGRGDGSPTRQECRVLAVNDELQVVVLDRGFEDGVREGALWRVMSGRDVLARLRVIEVRSSVSAAMVTDGRYKTIGAGAVVSLGE